MMPLFVSQKMMITTKLMTNPIACHDTAPSSAGTDCHASVEAGRCSG